MADVLRSCSKTACRWPAAASLSYRYATRQVWLLDLAATRDPSLYDLCPHHADALVVPKGWDRVDDRTVQEVMVEPSASDRAEEAARRRISAADPANTNVRSLVGASAGSGGASSGPPRNRYADLVDQLPRLAAEAGVPGAGGAERATISAGPATAEPEAIASAPEPESGAPAPEPQRSETVHAPELRTPTTIRARREAEQPTASEPPLPPQATEIAPPRPTMKHARAGAPVPSRDLAPLPPEEPPLATSETDEPLPGQLSIPVDVDDDDRGVVLPFELAGARRRPPRS